MEVCSKNYRSFVFCNVLFWLYLSVQVESFEKKTTLNILLKIKLKHWNKKLSDCKVITSNKFCLKIFHETLIGLVWKSRKMITITDAKHLYSFSFKADFLYNESKKNGLVFHRCKRWQIKIIINKITQLQRQKNTFIKRQTFFSDKLIVAISTM